MRLQPLLARIARGTAGGVGRAGAATGGWLWRQRGTLLRIALRLVWWAALVLLAVVGVAYLDGHDPSAWLDQTPYILGVGVLACAAVSLLAPESRIRVASVILGTAHGSLATLAWLAMQ